MAEYGVEEHGLDEAIKEGTTFWWSGTFKDPAGVAIPGANVTSIKLTLVDAEADDAIVNGRNEVEVLNSNGGTLTAGGVFTWASPQAADTAALGTKKYQKRKLTIEAIYNQGFLTHQVHFYIRNLTQVP